MSREVKAQVRLLLKAFLFPLGYNGKLRQIQVWGLFKTEMSLGYLTRCWGEGGDIPKTQKGGAHDAK